MIPDAQHILCSPGSEQDYYAVQELYHFILASA